MEYGVQVRRQRWRGWAVVYDRYWEDTLVDFRLHFPQEQDDNWLPTLAEQAEQEWQRAEQAQQQAKRERQEKETT